MKHVLNKTVHIAPTLTASDWQLYSSNPPRAESAALDLNETLRRNVNEGRPRQEVAEEMLNVMRAHRSVGATDSEPRAVLTALLDDIYGEHYYT